MVNVREISMSYSDGRMANSSLSSSRSVTQSEHTMRQTIESINFTHLDGLGDRELIQTVENLRISNKRLDIENEVWHSFLQKYEPKALMGLEKLMRYYAALGGMITSGPTVGKLQSQISLQPVSVERSENLSSPSAMSCVSKKQSSLLGSLMSGVPPTQRINLTMRCELVKREREKNETTVRDFVARSTTRRLILRAQLEELALQLAEIKEARDIFESTIIRDGVDPLTGRIPAEKFIRYMEEWLRSADSIIEKLRLRANTLKYRHAALKHQLQQKEELGETLNPVDFDQMKIDNKILMDQIENKNLDLLRLKQKAGSVNLMLAKRKRYLLKQMRDVKLVRNQIDQSLLKQHSLEKEKDAVETEVKRTEQKLNQTRELISKYTVPDVLDYVSVKEDLYQLRKSVKVWTRRNHLQKIAMDSCIKTMRQLTGEHTEHASWFEYNPQKEEDEESL